MRRPGPPGGAAARRCPADLRRRTARRADRDAGRGSVRFLDALPTRPPRLVVDVLTPHVKPYYDQANAGRAITEPPAEYHNPVPVRFLAVESTPLRSFLIGPATDLDVAVELRRAACDEWGLGGKTSAGYGYCTVEEG